jgi:hypothetical protein
MEKLRICLKKYFVPKAAFQQTRDRHETIAEALHLFAIDATATPTTFCQQLSFNGEDPKTFSPRVPAAGVRCA